MKRIIVFSQGSYGIDVIKKLFTLNFTPNQIVVVTDNQLSSNLPFITFLEYFKIGYLISKNNGEIYSYLSQFEYNFILSVSNRIILKENIIDSAKEGCINLHPGLLPEYRGCYSTPWSIIMGENKVGYTYHLINNQIDSGDILFREEIIIQDDDNAFNLNFKIMENAIRNLGLIINKFSELPRIKNDITKGRYFKNEFPYNGFIDLSWDEEKINLFFKASYFPPHSGVKLLVNDKIEEFKNYEEFRYFYGK